MKYAFIALIACYLLVYGCGPDNTKKAENKKEQAVHSTTEKPSPPAHVALQPETIAQPSAPAVDTPQPVQEVTPPPPTTAQAPNEAPPPPPEVSEAGLQPPVVAEEQKAPPCTMKAGSTGAVELTQPDEQNVVVLPCGRMVDKNQLPPDAPCLKAQAPPCPMMVGQKADADETHIMMPCGHVFVRHPMPDDETEFDNPPGQMQAPCPAKGQLPAGQSPEEDLAVAVERMVEATNDMVLVTQQLVIATQEMLRATQGSGNGGGNINQENLPTETSVQPPPPTAEVPPQNQPEGKAQQPHHAPGDAAIPPQNTNEPIKQPDPKVL